MSLTGAAPAPLGHSARLTLAAVVLLAAAMRFTVLDWGLRGPVHVDERVYVENVIQMVVAGDFDHRFYTYPGLFYYLLAPVVAALGAPRYFTNDAYFAARAVVAVCGTLNVALIFVVGRRILGTAAGLAAALFLAVSPLDVRTSHQVRPDILMEGFGLLALLQFQRLGSLREDVRAGLLIGAATAVKFTGLLMVPFYVLARLLARGPRVRGLVVAGLLTVGVVVVCTPYALIHFREYRSGPSAQLGMYYQGGAQAPGYVERVGFYVASAGQALGPVAACLFFLGLLLASRSEPRRCLPALLHPLCVWLVMSSAALAFPRLILPGMGVVYLLAALPVQWLAQRSRPLAVALALAAAALPARGTLRYLNLNSHASPQDQALDWFEAHMPAGTRVLETRMEGAESGWDAGGMLGIDRRRHDFVAHTGRDGALKLLARDMDLVVTAPEDEEFWGDTLLTVYEAHARRAPRTWSRLGRVYDDGPLVFRFQVPRMRLRYAPLDLSPARLSASEHAEQLEAVRDGAPASAWHSNGAATGREWLRIDLPAPATLCRVELLLGNVPADHAPDPRLRASADGQAFEPVESVHAQPALAEQLLARRLGDTRPMRQALVFEPRSVRALEVLQTGVRTDPWVVGELRLFAYQGETPYDAPSLHATHAQQ
jgi:Dolichyl-phosphate-mannose-protein mannosyltransferase